MGVGASPRRARAWAAAPVLALLVCCLAPPARASAGDRDPLYRSCVRACAAVDCAPSAAAPLPLHLRALGWTCGEDCAYRCARENHLERVRKGRQVVQYHGKWPFLRVLGMQELFSVLFSLANLVPHALYLAALPRLVPRSHPYVGAYRAFAAFNINTWVWSAAFHARDTPLTERLDYFCATLGITASLFITVLRVFEVRSRRTQAAAGALLGALLAAHVGYMHFVRMHYGWNMTVSLCAGAVYVALWLWWAAQHRARPYAWKVVLAKGGLLVFALFEVFDFPPLLDLLDAHAVWHGLTPAVSFLFYSFLVDDARWKGGAGVPHAE